MKININIIKNKIKHHTRLITKSVAFFVIGYMITVLIANPEIQDAFQYRLNLEQRLYLNEEVYKYNTWAILVNFLTEAFPNDDIFLLIGGAIAGTFLFCFQSIKLNTIYKLVFLVLFVSPLMAFNYTQILRQGLSASIITLALMLNPGFWAFVLLCIASYTHTIFAFFVSGIIFRYSLLKFINSIKADNSKFESLPRLEKTIDLFVFILIIPSIMAIAFTYAPADMLNKYVEIDFSNIKRIPISLSLVFFVFLLYPLRNKNRVFFIFSSYLIITVAFFLPFALDYTRANVLIFPFILFSTILCEKKGAFYGFFLACGLNFVILYYKF